MPYYKSYKNNDKWYALGAAVVFSTLISLAIYFNDEYSEENINRKNMMNSRPNTTEQSHIPEKLPNIDTSKVLNKDTIDAKLK